MMESRSFDHFFGWMPGTKGKQAGLAYTFELSTVPTIWDRLMVAGVSGTHYFSNLPFLGLWGPKYIPISRPYDEFVIDARGGSLSSFSFIDPKFTLADD